MSRTTWVLLLLGGLLLSALVAVRVVDAVHRIVTGHEHVTAPPPLVDVVPATPRHLRDVVELDGTLRPINEVDVVGDVGGHVTWIGAEIGDHVKKGQVLVRLEDTELAARVAQARAAVEAAAAASTSAARALKANEALYASQGISDVQITTIRGKAAAAKAQLDQAQAALRLAQAQLDHATIRSPIAGVVSERRVDVGQTVAPGRPLYHVQDLTELELEAQVDERVAAQVTPGLDVDVQSGGTDVHGHVKVVSPSLDPRTRKAKVIVAIPNAPLLPYATAEGRLVLQARDTLAVPLTAVVHDGGKAFVVRVVGDKAQRAPVQVGIQDGTWAGVAGLSKGDLVVTTGAAGLADGTVVKSHVAAGG